MKFLFTTVFVLFALASIMVQAAGPLTFGATRWWKGNLHTHTFWSDGDDYPEMVAGWYKSHGYNFLALSDHNILLEGEKWVEIKTNATAQAAFDKYQKFLESKKATATTREKDGKKLVRLKTLNEFRGWFEKSGEFLMIPSEEISASYEKLPIHINATNIRELIEPRTGKSVYEVMQNNIDAVLAQRERTGQPMFPHLNHPNFHYAVKAEELMRVKGERFFEVYNGHPQVFNEGDAKHAGTEKIWDYILAWRIAVLHLEPMYGLAVDDSHHYHKQGAAQSNTGRGWVMVNARKLNPESLINAMEKGDFYATSGVTLKSVKRAGKKLSVAVKAEAGTNYKIQFIGTRKSAVTIGPEAGAKYKIHESQMGEIFVTVEGAKGSYQLKGDELYVRAKIISSKLKDNAVTKGEVEQAWTQPLIPLQPEVTKPAIP